MNKQALKYALVTGAGIRIGRGIAEELLDQGYFLLLHAHNNFKELRKWVDASRHKAKVLALVKEDLSKEKGQEGLCRIALDLKVNFDILVNNASFFETKDFSKISRLEYQYMQSLNLEAPFFLSQRLLPSIAKSNFKSIINIGDAMWQRPRALFSHYNISKAGLSILTKSLANELAPNIRVNMVAPGAILFQNFHNEENKVRLLERIPFKRLGEVKDIAKMVVYISENALYMTGQIIKIDGGRSINP